MKYAYILSDIDGGQASFQPGSPLDPSMSKKQSLNNELSVDHRLKTYYTDRHFIF
jgi:hypothetical protein